jgi:hypothetical protein
VDVREDLPAVRPRRFYAVVKGRNLGIYENWKAVLATVSGFPHAKYKCFRTRDWAEDWYSQQLQILGVIPEYRDLSDDDNTIGENTIDLNSVGMLPGRRRPAGADPLPSQGTSGRSPSGNASLVDFRMAGPDTSTGQSKSIHDVSINITSEVRNLLCPKGLTQEMQDRMLEVTPDVLSCQGIRPLW